MPDDLIDFQPVEASASTGIDFQPLGTKPKGSIQPLNRTSAPSLGEVLKGLPGDMVSGYGRELKDLGASVNSAFGHVGDAVLGFLNLPYAMGVKQTPVTRENFMPQAGVEGLLNDIRIGDDRQAVLTPEGRVEVQNVPGSGRLLPPKLTHFLARGANEFVTPETAGGGLLTGGAGLSEQTLKALGIIFGAPVLAQVPWDLSNKDTEGAILHTIGGGLPLVASAVPSREAPTLGPGDIQSNIKLSDLDEMTGRVPPERQLAGPRGEFVGTARGDVIDFQQLSPMERTEFMRGPREYTPPPPPKPKPQLLLNAPDEPLQMGPTTLKQTLDNAQRLLQETPKEPNEPKGTADYRFSGMGPADYDKYQALISEIRTAVANRDFGRVMALQQEVEGLKNVNRGMPPAKSAEEAASQRVKPDNLRPAIFIDNNKVLVGERGDTHAMILERNGLDPETIKHSSPQRGFVDVTKPKDFLSRRQAESASELKGTAEVGGLDSQDLPGAAMSRLERMMAEEDQSKSVTTKPNEEAKFPTDTESQAEASKGLQATVKEVRQGTQTEERNAGIPLAKPIKELFDKVKLSGFVNRERASALRDAVDNAANIAGRQQENRVKQSLPSKVDRQAITFITEAGGESAKLNEFLKKVGTKHPEAQAALQRAIAELPRLRPHAEALSAQLEKQRRLENAKGVDTGYVANYMKHAYDSEDSGLFDTGHGGQGVSTSFLKPRTYPDYATAIADGAKPRTLDAGELIGSRIKAGQKLLAIHEWGNQLRQLKTPTGPFATDLVKRGKQWTAPDGYQVVETAPGVRTAIKDEYVGLIKNLTADSIVQGNWRLLLKGEGILKHGLLIFDSYHMFRMMWSQASIMGKVGYKKGLSVLEYDKPTIDRMVKNGDITPEMAKWVQEKRPIVEKLVAKGLNVGRLSEAVYDSVIHKALNIKGVDVNLLGRSYKWIFEKFTRGAMMETALYEHDRLKALNPSWTEDELAAHVAKQININFGNLQRQGVFKSQSARDLLQIAFLAPQWAESMAQKEIRAAKQLAEAPFTGKVGTLGKGVAVWTVAAFAANQIINMATRGKPTWENEEKGHKLDAFIPDIKVSLKDGIEVGKRKAGEGFWLSPFSSSAEYTHSYLAGTNKGQGPLATTGKIVQNKLSPVGRAVDTAVHGEDFSGRRLSDSERVKEVGKSLLPTPLPASGVLNLTPGSEQRQIYSSMGLRVEPAKANERLDQMSLEDRVALAKDTKSKQSKTYEGKERGAEQSATANIRRGKDVFDSLPRGDRYWLESRDLLLPGYETKIHYHGVDIPLSDSEQKRLGDLVKDGYSKAIGIAKDSSHYDSLSEAAKVKFFNELTAHARTTARKLLLQEMVEHNTETSDSTVESNNQQPRRFNTPGLDFRPLNLNTN